jgi:rare lipoprotein A
MTILRAGIWRSGVVLAAVALGMALSGCNSQKAKAPVAKAEINNQTKFSVAEYGVAASPRVTESRQIKKGGGRYQVGKPYRVRGKWYRPKEDPNYAATGLASWYGPNFHGRLTANGEIYDQYALSAAHPTLPLPSYVRVTNLDNDSSVIVRVNDRGPFHANRVIDLSSKAADLLDFKRAGVAKVKVEYVGKAKIEGSDDRFLLASYRAPGGRQPAEPFIVPGGSQPGTMIALADDAPASASFSGAISQAVNDEPVAFAGAVPVPTQRPVTWEGVPLDLAAEQPFLVATVEPNAYAADPLRNRFEGAFAALERKSGSSLPAGGADASQQRVILVGAFVDERSAMLVRSQFAGLAVAMLDDVVRDQGPVYEVRLLAGADVAPALLALVRASGHSAAQIED